MKERSQDWGKISFGPIKELLSGEFIPRPVILYRSRMLQVWITHAKADNKFQRNRRTGNKLYIKKSWIAKKDPLPKPKLYSTVTRDPTELPSNWFGAREVVVRVMMIYAISGMSWDELVARFNDSLPSGLRLRRFSF